MQDEKNINLKVFYYCVHKRMQEKLIGNCKFMSREKFERVLGEVYHIPKRLRYIVIKEMERQKMIKLNGTRTNNTIEILPLIIDPEKDSSLFYNQLGLF